MAEDDLDPLLEEKLDRALAPYVDLLPPEVLAQLREDLGDFATTHPEMARMLARLRPPPVVAESGEVPTSAAESSNQGDATTAKRGTAR